MIGTVPVAGLTLLLGVDRFMSEARAITNLIGNGVATLVIARWENAVNMQRVRAMLDGEAVVDVPVAALVETPIFLDGLVIESTDGVMGPGCPATDTLRAHGLLARAVARRSTRRFDRVRPAS
jgi:hypothetical protein